MRATFNAQERTLREMAALTLTAGWKIVDVVHVEASLFGHITAVPVEIPQATLAMLQPPVRPETTEPGKAFLNAAYICLIGMKKQAQASAHDQVPSPVSPKQCVGEIPLAPFRLCLQTKRCASLHDEIGDLSSRGGEEGRILRVHQKEGRSPRRRLPPTPQERRRVVPSCQL